MSGHVPVRTDDGSGPRAPVQVQAPPARWIGSWSLASRPHACARRPPAPRLAGRGRRRPRLAGRGAGRARLVRRPGQRDRGRELQGRLDRLGHPGRRRRRCGPPGLHDEHQRPAGRHGAVQDRRRRRVHDRHLPHGLLRRGGRARGGEQRRPLRARGLRGLPEARRHPDGRLQRLGRLGELGRSRHRGLRHLLREAHALGRRRQPRRVRRARRRRQLEPPVPDVGHDLAGLQRLRRREPVRERRRPAGRRPRPRLCRLLRPALHHARRTPRRTGCSTRSTRWSASSRPTATT